MDRKRSLAFFLALLMCLAAALPAMADVAKGKVVSGRFDNGDGITFMVPDGFTLYKQENKKAGFFRITMTGPHDKNGFGAALIIDITPGSMDVTEYESSDIVSDALTDYGSSYQDMYLMASETFTEYGVDGRRVFLTYRDGSSQNRTSYMCIYVFSTDRNIVRMVYDCYGAQRTMIDDLYALEDLFNNIIVP